MAKEQTTSSTTTIRIAVGSGNPCKIDAVKSAFESLYITGGAAASVQIVVTSHAVGSGVRDQPYGDDETKLGAVNRARAAWDDATKASADGSTPPDFAVGLEGGVEEAPASSGPATSAEGGVDQEKVLWCMAWMAIRGTGSERCTLARASGSDYEAPKGDGSAAAGREVWGWGRTGSFELPPKVARLVHGGMELGEADDQVFKRVNSKRGSGTVGKLTNGMIDRSNYYDHALKLALVPWIRPELYIE